MKTRPLLAALLAASSALGGAAWAQASGAAPATGKKEIVQKIVQLQQPQVEGMARQLVEMPAAQLLQQAGQALQQRVAADKREAVAQEIQADARRYVEEAAPIVRERALKLAPTTLGPILEEKMTEDELRQVLQIMQQLDSAAYRKYSSLGGEMQRALGEKLVAETRAAVEPKMQTLQDSVAKRLGVTRAPAAGKPAGPAASGAQKK